MTEPSNGQAEAPATPAEPVITIRFAGPGMADMTVAMPGIQLSQLMAAAWYLDALCREARAGIAAKQAIAQAGIDPASLPPDIRRMLHG